jgi:hypothetical protein
MLVTVIAPQNADPMILGAHRLFSLPIDAQPGFRRVGYDAEIPRLPSIIRAFMAAGIDIEHFYDF